MRTAVALAVAVAVAAVFAVALLGVSPSPEPMARAAAPGRALWSERTLDALAQGVLLLGAVLGVLALVGGRHGRKEGAR